VVAKHHVTCNSEGWEGAHPSTSLEKRQFPLADSDVKAVAQSIDPTDSKQVQLPLNLLFGEPLPEAKAKKQSGRTNTPKRERPASTESARVMLEEAVCRARAITASIRTEDRLGFAHGFVFDVISTYWRRRQPRQGRRWSLLKLSPGIEVASVPGATKEIARTIGTAAAGLDAIAASYMIGVLYTATMPDKYRAELGAYYTPPELCERLLDMATEAGVDWRSARVLDPACGGGAFLSAMAQRMADKMEGLDAKTALTNIVGRLCGFELDPFAAWMSQVFLEVTLDDLCRSANTRLPFTVRVCDGLAQIPEDRRFDLVVGNPPYGRVTLPQELRKVYCRSLFGHANLYGLFTDLALRFVRPGGIIAYVTPTSFLAGKYFKSLRGLLGQEAPPVSMGFVEARKGIFADVLQETLLATYCRGGNPRAAHVHFISPTLDGPIKTTTAGSFHLPKRPDQPWLIPRTQRQGELIRRIGASPYRLADYGYTVSTGPLVWNRHKESLRDVGGKRRYPVIWAESVRSDGVFEFRARKRNHQPYFEPKPNEKWVVTDFACVLLQRTTAKEQRRRLIAAELPASFIAEHRAVVVENHLNMVKPINGAPQVSPATVAELLNSEVVDQLFRCIGGSVAVSAYELEALPLPPPDALKEFERLVEQRVNHKVLERAVERLYGNGAA
jgi:adenine-specific DNA-methyltransferase